MFIATPFHWVDLAVRGIQFRISRGNKPIALLSPVEVNPNGIGAVE